MNTALPPTNTKYQGLPFRRQLRWRLAAYFVILAVLPVTIVTAVTVRRGIDQDTQQIFNQLQSVAELKRDQIRAWLQQGDLVLESLTGEANNSESFQQFLTQINASPDPQAIDSLLQKQVNAGADSGVTPLFKEFFIYSDAGHVVAASNPLDEGKVVTTQPYFAPSLKGDYVQPPYYSLTNTDLTMILTVPLTDATGKSVGVLAGQLNIATLAQIMTQRAGLGQTGETYLVSSENNFLLTPSGNNLPLIHAYHSEGIDEVLQGKDGAGIYTNHYTSPERVIGVYRWIPELQAGLLAEISSSEALAATVQTFNLSIILTIIAALIAILVGIWRISAISRSLSDLTRASVLIASGNRTERVKVRDTSEIGLLADSFNLMTDQLTSTINSLDSNLQELDVTNQALRIATAQAKEASRVKSEFLATMSHELRTPLNAIIGYSDILLVGLDGNLNDKHRHRVQRLKENGIRLLSLINDVLDITRMQAGRMELIQAPYSPQAVIARIAAQMESIAEQAGLKFEVSIDEQLPTTLLGDEKKIEQILVNLLSNAFKFTEEGSVKLDARTKPGEGTWTLSVADTGVGIPPHAINLIFEEFRQLDGGYSRVYKGSGLGLAITRSLVQLMDGKITVKSALNSGSTFTVTLPIVVSEASKLQLA